VLQGLRAPLRRTELIGYLTWAAAGAVFAVPELWAAARSDAPIPTLSGTVGHLERRWEIISLFVILVIAYALMHVVRVGTALIAHRLAPAASSPGTHIAPEHGRITGAPRRDPWPWLVLYFPFTLVVVALGFLIPLLVHNGHATDAEKQLSGEFGYGAMALTFFLIPGAAARLGVLVPFPALLRTILDLEQRIQIVAVVVVGSMTFLMLHLVFYPYPSIIPWFQNLEHLHNYCSQHPGQLLCHAKKK
jgi:hypothetical protein